MPDEDTYEDTDHDEISAMGEQRFASMSLFDSPVYLHPDPAWAINIRELAQRQLSDSLNLEELLCVYIELLHRAKSFVEFWNDNVGATEDWPISVLGDSAEVEACLMRRVDKLSSVVSFVEESACG